MVCFLGSSFESLIFATLYVIFVLGEDTFDLVIPNLLFLNLAGLKKEEGKLLFFFSLFLPSGGLHSTPACNHRFNSTLKPVEPGTPH